MWGKNKIQKDPKEKTQMWDDEREDMKAKCEWGHLTHRWNP